MHYFHPVNLIFRSCYCNRLISGNLFRIDYPERMDSIIESQLQWSISKKITKTMWRQATMWCRKRFQLRRVNSRGGIHQKIKSVLNTTFNILHGPYHMNHIIWAILIRLLTFLTDWRKNMLYYITHSSILYNIAKFILLKV